MRPRAAGRAGRPASPAPLIGADTGPGPAPCRVTGDSTSSTSAREVSGSTAGRRGGGPGLRRARGRPSRASRPAIQAGAPSGRPIVAARSSRAVLAWSAGAARRPAKSGTRAQRGHHGQFVVAAGQMRRNARPGPVFGPRDQACGDRIECDIPRRRQQMRLVHDNRAKAPLEQMPGPAEPRVDVAA